MGSRWEREKEDEKDDDEGDDDEGDPREGREGWLVLVAGAVDVFGALLERRAQAMLPAKRAAAGRGREADRHVCSPRCPSSD